MTRDAATFSLFPIEPASPSRPIARNADPETSHVAARRLTVRGTLGRQQQQTLDALRAWCRENPPPTSYELARGDVRLRYVYARRLADLRVRGLVTHGAVRTCAVTGEQALTWRAL